MIVNKANFNDLRCGFLYEMLILLLRIFPNPAKPSISGGIFARAGFLPDLEQMHDSGWSVTGTALLQTMAASGIKRYCCNINTTMSHVAAFNIGHC